jgi:uncharacterized protein YggE
MHKLIRVLALLSLLVPCLVAADGLPPGPWIQVSGHGALQVAPDMAYVYLTLEQTDKDAKAARADVEGRAAKVIALARKLGIADKDIDAPSVSVAPEYVWEDESSSISSSGKRVRKLTGYHVTRNIMLTLRDLDRYGELVDGLFQAGVDDLGNVAPDRSDRAALQQKALALAVADAHDQAAGLAKSAGVTLGAVYSISAQGEGGGPRPLMMSAQASRSAGAAPEYLNGKIEISADVQVYYLIAK